MAISEWDLTQTNMGRVRERAYEVAVLPTAAVEPHNLHLPYGQDFLHSNMIAKRCCEAAWEECESVVCLPGLPYGADCNLMSYPLAIHVSQAVLDAMVREIVGSLVHHGIRKVVLINGHGGNDFTPLVRQLQCDLPVHLFVCNWWTVGHDRYDAFFDKPDDHAGIMETSVGLHLFPELVEVERAGDGVGREYAFEAMRKGWVRSSRDFGKVNDHCAVGVPDGATAEAGKRYVELVVERVSGFLVELAKREIDEHFPFEADAK